MALPKVKDKVAKAKDKAKETPAQKKKAVQKGKTSRLASIGQYFRDVRSEFKKVIWPGREEIISSTIVVLTTLAFFAVLVGVMDFTFSQLIELLIP